MCRLSETLESFVQWRTHDSELLLRPVYQWPAGLAAVGRRLKGCWWGQTTNAGKPEIFGIRTVEDPFSGGLTADETAIFTSMRAHMHLLCLGGSDDVETCLIIQAVDRRMVAAGIALRVDGCKWYMLDERLVPLLED